MELLTHARIGYDNILARGTVEAGANEGSPASAAANPLTYSHWRATLGAPRTYTVELDAPETVDYFGIAAHNLDTANVLVRMQALINGAWQDTSILAGPTPGDVWTWDRDLRGERNSAPGATRATRVPGVARDGAPVLGPVGTYDPSEPDRLFAFGELQCRGTVTRRAVSSRVVYGIGTNLLTDNVSTGTDTLGDTTGFSGPNLASDNTQAAHGSRSLRLDYVEVDNDGVPLLNVPATPGDYALGFKIRMSGDLASLSLTVTDGDLEVETFPLSGANEDVWYELEIPITVGAGASAVQLYIEGSTTGATFWFDNMILTAGAVVPGFINRPWVPPGQTEYAVQIGETISTINMLHENVRTGSDFLGDLTGFADELGDGTGGATGESSTERAHTGSRSIKIPITTTTGVDLVVFPVDRAVPHTFSCWIWVDGTSSAPLLELTLADNTAPTVAIDTQVVPRRFGEWLHLSVTGTPDVAATEMVVALHTSGSVGPGCTVYLDDFQAEIGEGWTPWYNGISPPDITVHGTHSITLEPAVENLLPDGTRNTTSAGGVTGDVVVDPSRSVSSATSFMVAKFPFPGVIEPGSFSTDPITPTAEVNHVGQLKVYLDEPAWVRLCLEGDDSGEANYTAFEEYLAPGVWHTIITSGSTSAADTDLWLNFECSSHCWVAELAINETDRYVHWADGARDAGDLAYWPGLLRTASELTFSAWVQLPEEQPAEDQRILHLYRSDGGVFDSIGVQRNASSDEIRFFSINAEGLTVAVEPEVACDGKWHMLTAVLSSEGLSMYFDGQLAATEPFPTEAWRPDLSALSGFHVGHSPDLQSIGDGPAILLDDMIILGRALSADDIAALYVHEGAYTIEEVGLPLPVTDDRPIMQLVEPVRSAQFRLVFTPQESPSEDLKVGVIFIGKALEMPRPIYGGHTPEPFARVTSVRPNVSERGQLLGRYITRSGMANSWTWQHLPAAWVRRHLAPFIEHARTEPFFVLWRPESFPDEAAYCWTEEDLRASNMGIRDLMAFTINAVGI